MPEERGPPGPPGLPVWAEAVPWAIGPEPFAGAGTLLDLCSAPEEEAVHSHILARLACLQAAADLVEGRPRRVVQHGCSVAAGYLKRCPAGDPSREALLRALAAARGARVRPLVEALVGAGAAALDRGERYGAGSCFRAAFEAACRRGLHDTATKAALLLAELAAEAGDRAEEAWWRWLGEAP